MRRVQCASCGAPSVLGASRCPRCLAPFGAESPTSGVVLPPTPERRRRTPPGRLIGAVVAVVAVVAAVAVVGGVWAVTHRGPVEPAAAPVPAPVATPAAIPPAEVEVASSAVVPDTAVAAADSAVGAAGGARPVVAPVGPEAAVFAYVTTTWVRVRVAPDNAAQVLTILAPGARVDVVEIGRGWLRVRVPEGAGWVGAALLERVR